MKIKTPPKGVSKYTPTKGHKQGDVYKTDDRIINELKTIYKLSSLYDDPQAFIKSKLPTIGKNIYTDMLADRHLLGTFKYSRAKDTDNREYTSIYNYNPFGESFYDRIYDDEIEKLGGKIYRLTYKDDKNFFKYIKDLNDFFSEHKEYEIVHGHMQSMMPVYLKIAKNHTDSEKDLDSANLIE